MNTKKIQKMTFCSAFVCAALMSSSCFAQEQDLQRNWDESRSDKENALWESSLDMWEEMSEQWDKKRDRLHEEYYGESFSGIDDRKYCSDMYCWSEELGDLLFSHKTSGEKWDMDMDQNDIDITLSDGIYMEISNGGQVVKYKNPSADSWESSNSGQVITYTNKAGDFWETSNTGQVVTFKGRDGTFWKSSNFGQVVEHGDAEGNTWGGADSDDIDDIKFRNRM